MHLKVEMEKCDKQEKLGTQRDNIYDIYKNNTKKTDIDSQIFEAGEVKHEEWFAAATCQQALNAV